MEEYEEIFEFNELAQGYYKIDDPKLIPTYTELIAACSSLTFKSIKYVEDALKSRKCEIFPNRVSFEDEVKDATLEESKTSEKSVVRVFLLILINLKYILNKHYLYLKLSIWIYLNYILKCH